MRKKLYAVFCIGIMALSLAGCGDEAKKPEKKTETQQASTERPGEPEDTEREGRTEEEIKEPGEWKTGGSAELGYADVPADWTEGRTENETDASVYAIQYIDMNTKQAMLSFLENQYGYEGQELTVDPAEVIIGSYRDSYAQTGYTDDEITDVTLDGVSGKMYQGYMPAGVYTNYDYYTYTYVFYVEGRFYTVVIEGREDLIAAVKERFEITYTLPEQSGGSGNAPDSPGGSSGVSGSYDWEDYEVVMDGDLYRLPCDFSELASAGWSISDDYGSDTLAPDDFSSVTIERGGRTAWIMLANVDGAGTVSVQDAQVVGITIDYALEGTDSHIAGGLTLGMSYDDVIAVLGTPTDEYYDEEEGKEYYVMMSYEGAAYEQDYFSSLEVTVSEGVVSEIEISHWK